MKESNTTDSGLNIFLARQPIFDRRKEVIAYELLYRSDLVNRAFITDEKYATLKVIANSLLMGLQKLTEGKRAYLHFNQRLLLGKAPLLFPRDLLGVEIIDEVESDERIINACSQFKKNGYQLILDYKLALHQDRQLLELCDIVKIDFLGGKARERHGLVKKTAQSYNSIKFLAERVETIAQFDEAEALGCTYFQGYFFRKPDLVTRKEMPGYKLNYLRILKKIHELSPRFDEIEEIIKRDVSLTYKLLRFINSASYGFKVTVRSIHHALILLGKREVKKWLTIIVMSGIGRSKPTALMNAVIVRARFCELIAQTFRLHSEPTDFFLLGMFSMVDAFLDRPVEEILEELPLEENVKDALLGKPGRFFTVLQLVSAFEKGEWDTFAALAWELDVSADKTATLYLEAVEWSKFMSEGPEETESD